MNIGEIIIDTMGKQIFKIVAKEPKTNDFIVAYDGKAPEAAARKIAMYLAVVKKKPVFLMDAHKYEKYAKKTASPHKSEVLIVGHHDLTKKEIKNVTSCYSEYGMEYGKSVKRYVLTASRSNLGNKDAFAKHYNNNMGQRSYQELAKSFGTPEDFESHDSTREAQYGLLWIEFVLREFPQSTEHMDSSVSPHEAEPLPAYLAPHIYSDKRPADERDHEQAKIAEFKAQGRLKDGIVFCGGGARGAFALGVWKYLAERGLAERFTGIAGASVGALNTLLFAQGDYSKAESVWLSMNDGDLVQPNEKLERILEDILLKHGNTAEKFADFLRNWQENAGVFSKEKLSNILKENISITSLEDKLAYASVTVFGTESEDQLYLEYAYLDSLGQSPEETNIRKVLASAALPGAFVPEKVNGRVCIDGGVLDNCPVYPLVKAGFREILVVHLSSRFKKETDRLKEFNRDLGKRFTPDELMQVQFYHIWPEISLGDLLKISPELTKQRIQAGYEAAYSQLRAYPQN